ncbi:hypothetical protein [uncultured Akkermansia sp.]|jgi:hypothetical protein|uniref:hypothetical protein n=1 Tax=uncultured Akkermansia sp. TaxID=512294 RepID=UPI0025FC95E0|nr:hypothetical protein [uncultured Akkermansia sp.]
MNKITSINGILLTPQNDFYQHEKNNSAHITEDERTAWNSKAEASEVNSKVSTEAFDAHKADASVHITDEERTRWNTAPQLDESGNMTLAGSLTTAGTYNANGGINIPVDPVTETDAARKHEVRVLNEIANGAACNYFNFSTPPFGRLLSPFSWLATYWPKPATENGWVDFNFRCLPFGQQSDRGGSYSAATGVFFPLSTGLGYQRMFQVVAGGLLNVTLNEAWATPDDHPFSEPANGVAMWWDVYFGDTLTDQGNKIPARGRLCRFNHNTNQVELFSKTALLPENFRLRGIAIAWGNENDHGGIWVVGANEATGGRLEAYRICEKTWFTSSYQNCVDLQNIRLLCNREALEVGVEPLKTYTGLYGQKSVVAEWCEMMEVK